jgi:sec-independent protein translocase protein TatA
MRLGFGEILLILAVALLIFGPSKLPQLGEALGKGIRNFKKSSEGNDDAPPPAKEPAATELPAHVQGASVQTTKQAAPSDRKPS